MTATFGITAKAATEAMCVVATLLFAQTANAQTTPADDFAKLLAVYPSTLDRIDNADLVTKSGRRIRIDNGKGARSHTAMLDDADIKDMFAQSYPTGASTAPPALNFDPGRARSTALFDAMYGDCTRNEVAPNLVSVPWVPSKGGGTLKVTRINGVAEKLAAVSRELDQLPKQFDKYLLPSSGTYNCRDVAGTKRPSTHRWGTAIDLAADKADYWRWTSKSPPEEGSTGITYRNSIPMEIVSIFERHGFIWGGRWYHYDTMHFEYRPELLSRP